MMMIPSHLHDTDTYNSLIGPVIVVDKMNPLEVENLIDHIGILKPKYITVVAGTRYTEALDISLELQKIHPRPKIIFVNWPNHENWIAIPDPNKWYETNLPLIERDLLVQTTSEETSYSLNEDYFLWNAKIIQLAGEDGYGVAVANHELITRPSEMMIPLAEALHIYRDYSIWNPRASFSLSQNRSSLKPSLAMHHLIQGTGLEIGDIVLQLSLRINDDPDLGWRFIKGLSGYDYYKKILLPELRLHRSFNNYLQLISYYPWYTSPFHHVDEAFMSALEQSVTDNEVKISEPISHLKVKRLLPERPIEVSVSDEIMEQKEEEEDVETLTLDLTPLWAIIAKGKKPQRIQFKLYYDDYNKGE